MSDVRMTCDQACRLSHLELDGGLDPAQFDALCQHRQQCEACQREWQLLFSLHRELVRARFAFRRRVPHPPDVGPAVVARIRAEPQRRLVSSLTGVLVRAAAVAAVVVIAAGWRLPDGVGRPPEPQAASIEQSLSPSLQPAGRLPIQARFPAFEFEDGPGQLVSEVWSLSPSRPADPERPTFPSGPPRLLMN